MPLHLRPDLVPATQRTLYDREVGGERFETYFNGVRQLAVAMLRKAAFYATIQLGR